MSNPIEKFIDAIGIKIVIERSNVYRPGTNRPTVCYLVRGYFENEKTYEHHHCFSMKKDGTIVYEEGNKIMDASQGMFNYLGMNPEVEYYFYNKTSKMAKEFLIDFLFNYFIPPPSS